MSLANPLIRRVATPLVALATMAGLSVPPACLDAQSLVGSHESLERQNLVAQQHDYAYLRNRDELSHAIAAGTLVEVTPNGSLELAGSEVSFPYARPEVNVFLSQLAREYTTHCGEPLVVTSLVRPIADQPWNASPLSVHPTGMAVDLRRSDRRSCRQWLESTLLILEEEGMIEATRERWPAHYHVAVFPDPLLAAPNGDPNGVARLVALHGGPGIDREAAAFATTRSVHAVARGQRLHVQRSARTGRLQITGQGAAHGQGRVVVARAAAPRRGRGRHPATTVRRAVDTSRAPRGHIVHAASRSRGSHGSVHSQRAR